MDYGYKAFFSAVCWAEGFQIARQIKQTQPVPFQEPAAHSSPPLSNLW
jgi:hypothetical protein